MLQFPAMSLEQVVRDLEEERDRLDGAIQILRGVHTRTRMFTRTGTKPISPATRRKIVAAGPSTMSAAARRKISLAQKARWAKRRAVMK
jgi:hypothetical protein